MKVFVVEEYESIGLESGDDYWPVCYWELVSIHYREIDAQTAINKFDYPSNYRIREIEIQQ